MKKVLLTGASGFIGYHCIQPLVDKGYEVHCVSARGYSDKQENVTWHQANLLESADIQRVLDEVKPEYLLHMAWFVEPGAVINYPDNILWVEKTIELLRGFVAGGGKRVTFCGSCYEYDWQHGYCNEEVTPTDPDTYYGIAKNALRQLYEKYVELTEISGAWGRVFFLYGPRENPKRLVSSVILSLLNDQDAKCSHGKQIRDYMHVQDVADGLVTLMDSELSGSYNICSGQTLTLKDIVVEIGKSFAKPELIKLGALPARANDLPLVIGDTRKFFQATGWEPKFDLAAGIEHTINWWKANHESFNR